MKVGVFTVGLPDLTPEEAVREIKDAGYDGVEWRITRVPEEARSEEPSFWGNNLCTLAPTKEEARRARRISEEAGLEIPGLGTYVAVGDLEAANEAMRFAVTAGAPQVRVGAGAPDGRPYEELFSAAREFLAGVEDLARSNGVKALIEIHHGTICPSASLAHRLVSTFDPDLVGVILDPGNMAQEGFEDYRIGAELLGPLSGARPHKELGLRAARRRRRVEAAMGAPGGRDCGLRPGLRGTRTRRIRWVARDGGLQRRPSE